MAKKAMKSINSTPLSPPLSLEQQFIELTRRFRELVEKGERIVEQMREIAEIINIKIPKKKLPPDRILHDIAIHKLIYEGDRKPLWDYMTKYEIPRLREGE
jgi:hypothetical protein